MLGQALGGDAAGQPPQLGVEPVEVPLLGQVLAGAVGFPDGLGEVLGEVADGLVGVLGDDALEVKAPRERGAAGRRVLLRAGLAPAFLSESCTWAAGGRRPGRSGTDLHGEAVQRSPHQDVAGHELVQQLVSTGRLPAPDPTSVRTSSTPAARSCTTWPQTSCFRLDTRAYPYLVMGMTVGRTGDSRRPPVGVLHGWFCTGFGTACLVVQKRPFLGVQSSSPMRRIAFHPSRPSCLRAELADRDARVIEIYQAGHTVAETRRSPGT